MLKVCCSTDPSSYLMCLENKQSRLTYKWVPFNFITNKTGVCLKYSYKITGSNNTLSVSFQSLLGEKNKVWQLKGNQGSNWERGEVFIVPTQDFTVSFGSLIYVICK